MNTTSNSVQSSYLELKITAPSHMEDDLSMLLFDHGAEGVESVSPDLIRQYLDNGIWDAYVFDEQDLAVGQVFLRAWFSNTEEGCKLLKSLLKKLRSYSDVDTDLINAPVVDWQSKWREGFAGRAVGDLIWLRPCWDEAAAPEDRVELVINPGMAFGTGDHPTTSLVLELMEKYITENAQVSDLGCGSGILAIAALKLGASRAIAVDIDEVCRPSVAEHMELNSVLPDQLEFHVGDVLHDDDLIDRLSACPATLLLANITANVLCALAPAMSPFMEEGAYVICSGIINKYSNDVEQALISNNLQLIEKVVRDEWTALVAQKIK